MTASVPNARANSTAQRQLHLDALKLIGSQLIVLHHLSAYGPVADAASQWAPEVMGWLYDYARMAVQIFLVLGGYLALRSLQPALASGRTPLAVVLLRRYLRLAGPFAVALGLAVGAAALARMWLSDDFIPAAPSVGQLLAHVLLLQGMLGTDALSAGVWYVAIDFQLFVLLALLLWPGPRRLGRWGTPLLILAGLGLSLLLINRDDRWDNWALYFFGAYGLGAAVAWAQHAQRPRLWLALLGVLALGALWLEFRTRIALALAVAVLLALGHHLSSIGPGLGLSVGLQRIVHVLGRSSYALFLVHFPVLVLGNVLYVHGLPQSPGAATAALLVIWGASVALGLWFERWVETPLAAWAGRWVSGLGGRQH